MGSFWSMKAQKDDFTAGRSLLYSKYLSISSYRTKTHRGEGAEPNPLKEAPSTPETKKKGEENANSQTGDIAQK